MRGRLEFSSSAETVLKSTEDYETRKKWDELFVKGTVLETLDDTHQVVHFQFKVSHRLSRAPSSSPLPEPFHAGHQPRLCHGSFSPP